MEFLKTIPSTVTAFAKQKKRWVTPALAAVLLSSLLITASILCSSSSSSTATVHGGGAMLLLSPSSAVINSEPPLFVEARLKTIFEKMRTRRNPPRVVPKLAYLISGSAGDGEVIQRTLRAVYHPNNVYVLHLDLAASPADRLELAAAVKADPVYGRFGNVRTVARANLVTYRGPTMVANTLHAAAILLKEAGDWDWFINLSASDYPLVPQDDLLYALSTIPRHLNFIEHTSNMGWKEFQRAKPVIIDPGLYSSHKSDVFWVTEKRSVPTAFKLFTGSAWMMLTHQFIEFCLWGWDNLPRTVLMYYANFLSSPEGYFHTVICNSDEFRNTTVNHDLHFITWDNPPKQHPHFLTLDDFQRMVGSNAPFARKFGRNDPVLDKIDKELLGLNADGFAPGWWYEMVKNNLSSTHYIEKVENLRPGPGAQRVKQLITGLLSGKDFDRTHCL